MTKEYVQMVGRMAYFWGWPLMSNANRAVAFSKAPEPGLMGGVIPIAYGGIAMQTDYVTPNQRFIACANQDVVYGIGFLRRVGCDDYAIPYSGATSAARPATAGTRR